MTVDNLPKFHQVSRTSCQLRQSAKLVILGRWIAMPLGSACIQNELKWDGPENCYCQRLNSRAEYELEVCYFAG